MQTAIITGANGNLGKVVTKKFIDEGYNVIATVSTESKKDFMQHELLKTYAVDLKDENEAGIFINDVIENYTKIDAGIFLAGGFAMGDINSTSIKNVYEQFALNFETAYIIATKLFQHMMEQKEGKIILTGARPVLKTKEAVNKIAYTLSKSLLFKLAEILNAAAGKTNVVTSVIVPSTIDTVDNRKDMPNADFENWVKPEEIADTILFLCSQQANGLREPVIKLYKNA